MLKKCLLVFALIAGLLSMSPVTVTAADNEVVLDGEFIHFEILEEEDSVTVMAINRQGKVLETVYRDENQIFRDLGTEKELIGTVQNSDPVVLPSVLATEPVWGPLLSQTKTITYPNPESTALVTLTSLIAGIYFPGLSVGITIAQAVAEYIGNYHPAYVTYTVYYNEASGCSLYRWYRRQVYRDPSGNTIRDYTLNQKSFIGVKNSPDNPPACRAYGF